MTEKSTTPNRDAYWRKTVSVLAALAEISNIGIVLDTASQWASGLARLAAFGFFPYLILITDPLIYFFRGLIRLTRLVGRNFFNVKFDEEKHGTHQYQSLGDIVTLVCFGAAIALFCGLIAAPVGITLAWVAGLSGLSVIGYFDYIWPMQQAKKHYQQSLPKDNVEATETARKEYIVRRNSMRLFIALLSGLSLLLLCGSAAVFAPPLLVPILAITAKVASIYLVGIAVGRFTHWSLSGIYTRREDKQRIHPEQANEYSPTSQHLIRRSLSSEKLSTPFLMIESDKSNNTKNAPIELEELEPPSDENIYTQSAQRHNK